uniref:ADF-H domain-containing protein n=1 Tax=Arcella intermedia TaxID=1963864 RepID=A0A6B2LPW1_9EUKA
MSKNQSNRAYIFKINKIELKVEEEKIVEEITDLTEFAEDHLPEGEPRFIAYSTKQNLPDGRVTFPLLFIFYCPPASVQLNSLYASTKGRFCNFLEIMKSFECRDREEFTNEWMDTILLK